MVQQKAETALGLYQPSALCHEQSFSSELDHHIIHLVVYQPTRWSVEVNKGLLLRLLRLGRWLLRWRLLLHARQCPFPLDGKLQRFREVLAPRQHFVS